MGHALFDRVGRGLVLTEVGRIALEYAERIFGNGEELLATLKRTSSRMPPLRVGAQSTMSRNFQLSFLRPMLGDADANLVLRSGGMRALVEDLKALALDVVLTTELPAREAAEGLRAARIASQDTGLHGHPGRLDHKTLPDLLAAEPLILPTDSVIRTRFDSLCSRLDVSPRVVADVDDMAMIRLLTREDAGVAIAPAVVLADEIASGLLATAPFSLNIVEPFYALTVPRHLSAPGAGKVAFLAQRTFANSRRSCRGSRSFVCQL